MIDCFLCVRYRHVVTAAHCICTKDDPDSVFLCRPSNDNQIVETKNEIAILAGSKRVRVLQGEIWRMKIWRKFGGNLVGIKQKADQAYVMDEFVQNPLPIYDIGIIISETKPFFKHHVNLLIFVHCSSFLLASPQ